jgi:hypothetical protein
MRYRQSHRVGRVSTAAFVVSLECTVTDAPLNLPVCGEASPDERQALEIYTAAPWSNKPHVERAIVCRVRVRKGDHAEFAGPGRFYLFCLFRCAALAAMFSLAGTKFGCVLLILAACVPGAAAESPFGLDSRAAIGPFLNGSMPPKAGASTVFPARLSDTGAFSDVRTLTPAVGVIPYGVKSPLWSDGAAKKRWIAVPNDGAPYGAGEQIGFAPLGEWTFPVGTVFVKHFELTVNASTGETKRIETRLLVRDADGGVYGVTYKWNPENSDAYLLQDGLEEGITITSTSGATRVQNWSYPSRADCLECHNAQANYVLGVKTHQLNGDFTYPSTGRTDNQLRVFAHLGMLNPAPKEADIPTYLKSVAVTDRSVPIQHRIRSWIDANCSQCHRPGGEGPRFDGRLYTPLNDQSLINSLVKFRDLDGSRLYQRDNSLDFGKMPPLAKNVIDESAMAVMRQWIASPVEVLSVYLYQDASHLAVRFNSHVDPATATVTSNYSLDQGQTISQAALSSQPDTIILTLAAPLSANQTYVLTTNDVQDTAPSANTIWPGTQTSFTAQFTPAPVARLANISTRVPVGGGDDAVIGGFIVRGTAKKRVMIRGLGPSLASNNIANALPDPVLELHDSTGALVGSNDNWGDNPNAQEIIDTTIAPTSPKESVILTQLPSNDTGIGYTAILRGASVAAGVALVEVYDLDGGLGSAVLNVSTRGHVETGENVMIGGFILGGNESQKIIVRAIGPSLAGSGVANPLNDPVLELHNSNGDAIASDDGWKDKQQTEIQNTGVPPTDDRESAIVAVLPAGSYTAVVRGANNSTGVALVEAYQLP